MAVKEPAQPFCVIFRGRGPSATIRVILLLLSPLPAAPLAGRLHARNRHAAGYDIERLARSFPSLREHVIPASGPRARATIDFARPGAVGALNAALIAVDYGIRGFALPDGRLCPAVPGRADYLHVIADLLAADNGGGVPRGPAVRGLDIGVGASCIYPSPPPPI
ncbi:hypothetical protein EMIHUDRAFT_125460, partial [Emiliania huxleyi CCMP1516]|uniref:Uncharacterized protein n=2 Tax=Emiliania huxleyi TaxID=2903 RepID=A0A0D3HXC0_EMIH1